MQDAVAYLCCMIQ